MKAPTSRATKIVTWFVLGLFAWGCVGFLGLFVPTPYHYTGIFLPFLLLYLLGAISSYYENRSKNPR